MSEHTRQGFSTRVNAAGAQTASDKRPNFQTKGALIMQLAELLRPALQKKLEGARDENGMPVQPARIRGMALIIAQELVKAKLAEAA